jgi:hypothetical protein
VSSSMTVWFLGVGEPLEMGTDAARAGQRQRATRMKAAAVDWLVFRVDPPI